MIDEHFWRVGKEKVWVTRYEARSRGRSSPDSLAVFERAKRPDDRFVGGLIGLDCITETRWNASCGFWV